MQITTTLKNIATLFARMPESKDEFKVVFVNNGVGNVTDKSFLLRFEVDAPNGRYDINEVGALIPSQKPRLVGDFGRSMDFPFDPELIRPPFEHMKPWCVIEPQAIYGFFELLQIAKKREDRIYIEKRGMGLKREGDLYIDFNFGIPHKLELEPHYLHLAFTDSLRYPRIEIYQEIRPEHGEEPQTPLVVGFGWKNCSLIMPRVDAYRSYYS
jgi:hypothetical protein